MGCGSTPCIERRESSNVKSFDQSMSLSVPYPDGQRRCESLERPRCEQRASAYWNRWDGVRRWPAECIGCENLDYCGPSIYLNPGPIAASIPRSLPLHGMRKLEKTRMTPGLCRRGRYCWLRVLRLLTLQDWGWRQKSGGRARQRTGKDDEQGRPQRLGTRARYKARQRRWT